MSARNVNELRALAHPLRLRLIEYFASEPRTTMQVAELMGLPPTRLYHHVNILERAGILRLRKTRKVRGTTEKYFEIARHRLGMMRAKAASRSRPKLRSVATLVFDEARNEILAALSDSGPFNPVSAPLALRMLVAVPPSHQKRVRRIILSTIKRIKQELKGSDRALAPNWALTLGFAPTLGRSKRPR